MNDDDDELPVPSQIYAVASVPLPSFNTRVSAFVIEFASVLTDDTWKYVVSMRYV